MVVCRRFQKFKLLMKNNSYLKQPNLIARNGELYLYEQFLTTNDAHYYYEKLMLDTPWQQRKITMFGKTFDQPRLVSWHAEPGTHYQYSGIKLTPSPWTDALLTIKSSVEAMIGHSFNSAFLNLYRSGEDYMGWHRDNEKVLGNNPVIASVSLGEKRLFKLKHISDSSIRYNYELNSGCLLVMAGQIQHYWKHSLPKSRKAGNPRINITFRHIIQ